MRRLIATVAAVILAAGGSVFAAGEEKGLFPDSVTATVATPLYSAFHRPGKEVRVILTHGAAAPDGAWLPPGTLLTGEVLAASRADARAPGRLEVNFSRAFPPRKFSRKISAGFAAPGGILSADIQSMVLQRMGNRELDALEAEIRSRSGSDPSMIRRFEKNRQKAPSGSGGQSREVILDAGDQVLIRFESR